MSKADSDLLAEVERFLMTTGMGPTYFGKVAVGNPELVNRLRQGRSVTQKTAERLHKFLQAPDARQTPSDPHRFTVRVYYEDTDFSGNVYHSAYLHFFERGRTEFLRAIGVHHSELIEDGIAFAVRSMAIEFDAPAHIDDLLMVETRVENLTSARLHLDQQIVRDGVVITRAKVLVVAINAAGRPARMPKAILAGLGSSGG
jgi:acyl-CoA thioester hydrolase